MGKLKAWYYYRNKVGEDGETRLFRTARAEAKFILIMLSLLKTFGVKTIFVSIFYNK